MTKASDPWADTPFSLVPTPCQGEDLNSVHSSIWIAQEMAHAHNGMLRGLNSIYHQCIWVTKSDDIKDLLLYARLWCGWIHEHHEGEENMFFPDVEAISGVEGLMAQNVQQHHAFEVGLKNLEDYASKTSVGEYDGQKLRSIIDGFGGILTKHLTEEIQTLLALKIYDGPALKKAYLKWDHEMKQGDKSTLYPIVAGSVDRSYEGATDWPQIPGILYYVVHYWFERKYQGAWRFSPSDTWGNRRPLMFTKSSATK